MVTLPSDPADDDHLDPAAAGLAVAVGRLGHLARELPAELPRVLGEVG